MRKRLAFAVSFAVLLFGSLLLASEVAWRAAVAPPPVPVAVPATAPDPQSQLVVVVVDRQGHRITAQVHLEITTISGLQKVNLDTSANGRILWHLDRANLTRLAVQVSAAGYAPRMRIFQGFGKTLGDELPAVVPFRLDPGTQLHGRVIDAKGQPVAGTTVALRVLPAAGHGPDGDFLAPLAVDLTTDGDGRWVDDEGPGAGLAMVAVTIPNAAPGSMPVKTSAPVAQFIDGVVTTLPIPALLHGRVLGADDQPLYDARVYVGGFGREPSTQHADEDGEFTFRPAFVPGPLRMVVVAPGYSPLWRDLAISDRDQPQTLHLKPGVMVGGTVVDTQGNAVAGVQITVRDLPSGGAVDFKLSALDGSFYSHSAPCDDAYRIDVRSTQYRFTQRTLRGDHPDEQLVLQTVMHVTGTVIDALHRVPVPKARVLLGREDQDHQMHYAVVEAAGNGQFSAEFNREAVRNLLRVEAPGFLPAIVPLKLEEDHTDLSVGLVPHADLTGVALDPQGRPVPNAEVTIANAVQEVRLVGDHVDWRPDDDPQYLRACTTTDENGRWRLPADAGPYTLVIVHRSGVALVNSADLPKDGRIKLVPWASLSVPGQDKSAMLRGVVEPAQAGMRVMQVAGPAVVQAGRTYLQYLMPGRARIWLAEDPVLAIGSAGLARPRHVRYDPREDSESHAPLDRPNSLPPAWQAHLETLLTAGAHAALNETFAPRTVDGQLHLTAAARGAVGPLGQASMIWHVGTLHSYNQRQGAAWEGDVVAPAAVADDGRFKTVGVRPGMYVVTVGAPQGKAVVLGEVNVPPGAEGDPFMAGTLGEDLRAADATGNAAGGGGGAVSGAVSEVAPEVPGTAAEIPAAHAQ